MVTKIRLSLYKNDKLVKEYSNINCIYQNKNISFKLNDYKMIINKNIFIRENNEYKFNININSKVCSILLKSQNKEFDIKVEKLLYEQNEKRVVLIYKIESDEEETKILIEFGG